MAINKKYPILKCAGQATLVAGVATVAEEQVAVGDRVIVSYADPLTLVGSLTVLTSEVTAGQFIVRSITPGGTSAATTDVSLFNYLVITF